MSLNSPYHICMFAIRELIYQDKLESPWYILFFFYTSWSIDLSMHIIKSHICLHLAVTILAIFMSILLWSSKKGQFTKKKNIYIYIFFFPWRLVACLKRVICYQCLSLLNSKLHEVIKGKHIYIYIYIFYLAWFQSQTRSLL